MPSDLVPSSEFGASISGEAEIEAWRQRCDIYRRAESTHRAHKDYLMNTRGQGILDKGKIAFQMKDAWQKTQKLIREGLMPGGELEMLMPGNRVAFDPGNMEYQGDSPLQSGQEVVIAHAELGYTRPDSQYVKLRPASVSAIVGNSQWG